MEQIEWKHDYFLENMWKATRGAKVWPWWEGGREGGRKLRLFCPVWIKSNTNTLQNLWCDWEGCVPNGSANTTINFFSPKTQRIYWKQNILINPHLFLFFFTPPTPVPCHPSVLTLFIKSGEMKKRAKRLFVSPSLFRSMHFEENYSNGGNNCLC